MKKYLTVLLALGFAASAIFCLYLLQENANLRSQNDSLHYSLQQHEEEFFATPQNDPPTEDTFPDYVLYDGFVIDTTLSAQMPYEMLKSEYDRKHFDDRLFYNYSQGQFTGKTLGLVQDYYEDSFYVANVGKFSFTKEFDVAPRPIEHVWHVPDVVLEKNPELQIYDNVNDDHTSEVFYVNLDGDGTREHILCYNDVQAANTTTALYDADGDLVDVLMYMRGAYWGGIESPDNRFLMTGDNMDALDIDNDGIMEILINAQIYEGYRLGIFKYDGEQIVGESNIDCTAWLLN